MSASPTQVNGTSRPRRLPVMGDWRPIDTDTNPEQAEVVAAVEPPPDPVAEAEAAAIRARSYAETEERRIKAEAEAEAIRIKAAAEDERTRLSNERAAMRLEKDKADHTARIAEANRKREEAERVAAEAHEQAEAEKKAKAEQASQIQVADDKWRKWAIRFAIVCGIVALPVQMNAFWNPAAPWMVVAPVMLEGGAWVVHRGAAAAVANRRPVWHYRTIVWVLALIAAAINLSHGLAEFDLATAVGTAIASVAGPGVWDLHEHGRIRTRDGKPTRKERRAQEKAEKRAEAERKATQKKAETEKKAAAEATKVDAEQLAQEREKQFPKVWEHALKLAADLGETTVTEPIWKRAKLDVEGAPPGESADVIRMRNAAEARVEAARQKKPVSTLSKTMNAQRASQMPPSPRKRRYNPPTRSGVRRPGDTPKYVNAARAQASITAKHASKEEAK